jgi:hypothetical protein
LRPYATSRKVVGSSPDEVDFVNLLTLSSRTMALGSTEHLREMSASNFPGVKGGRIIRLTTSPPSLSQLSRQNVEASMSHKPMGLHGLLQG